MFPDLFSIGPLTIHSYGLFVAAGIAVGLLITVRIGKLQGIGSQQVLDMGFVLVLSGIIGSRLLYVIMNLSYYIAHPVDILKIWHGGLVFSGGLIAAVLVMIWYIRRHGFTIWQVGDLWAPALAIGQGIGRIGCFMAGCCYGRPTDVFWGVIFRNPKSIAPLNTPLHPTQLYASFSGLIIFIILMILSAKKRFEGQVFLWFLILHSTSRLLMERFRGDERAFLLGSNWTVTQVLSSLILVASVVALFYLKSRRDRETKNPAVKG